MSDKLVISDARTFKASDYVVSATRHESRPIVMCFTTLVERPSFTASEARELIEILQAAVDYSERKGTP
jgi:hypothetical protein